MMMHMYRYKCNLSSVSFIMGHSFIYDIVVVHGILIDDDLADPVKWINSFKFN